MVEKLSPRIQRLIDFIGNDTVNIERNNKTRKYSLRRNESRIQCTAKEIKEVVRIVSCPGYVYMLMG